MHKKLLLSIFLTIFNIYCQNEDIEQIEIDKTLADTLLETREKYKINENQSYYNELCNLIEGKQSEISIEKFEQSINQALYAIGYRNSELPENVYNKCIAQLHTIRNFISKEESLYQNENNLENTTVTRRKKKKCCKPRICIKLIAGPQGPQGPQGDPGQPGTPGTNNLALPADCCNRLQVAWATFGLTGQGPIYGPRTVTNFTGCGIEVTPGITGTGPYRSIINVTFNPPFNNRASITSNFIIPFGVSTPGGFNDAIIDVNNNSATLRDPGNYTYFEGETGLTVQALGCATPLP